MGYQFGLGLLFQSFSQHSSISHDLLNIKGVITPKLLHGKKSYTPWILLSNGKY
jgi:hypothetical protein